MDRRVLARYLIRETMGIVIVGVALFWAAGTLRWWPGWALVGLTAVWVAGMTTVILRFNPDMLAERLGARKQGERWDRVIMSIVGVSQLIRLVVAGLDERFGWTPGFSPTLQVAGLGAALLGYALVVWATAVNAHFSQIVRIQTERDHTVATGGPYRWVRHPAYASSIVNELAVPLLLDSWWALIPGVLNATLFVVRTALEDRTLKESLAGYAAYAQEVSHRLVPGIW
jgi:protein-S-isoprenylcysteine O-methyltransferase Ste14